MGEPLIGIDPGSEKSAIVRLEGGIVTFAEILPNDEALAKLVQEDPPVIIEMVSSYGMAVGKSVFETVYWIGRFSEAVGGAQRIYRKDIKLQLCGNFKAKDPEVRQALIDRFGGLGGKEAAIGKKATPGPLYGIKSHLWAALAVAVAADENPEKTF